MIRGLDAIHDAGTWGQREARAWWRRRADRIPGIDEDADSGSAMAESGHHVQPADFR